MSESQAIEALRNTFERVRGIKSVRTLAQERVRARRAFEKANLRASDKGVVLLLNSGQRVYLTIKVQSG